MKIRCEHILLDEKKKYLIWLLFDKKEFKQIVCICQIAEFTFVRNFKKR